MPWGDFYLYTCTMGLKMIRRLLLCEREIESGYFEPCFGKKRKKERRKERKELEEG